MKNTSIYLTNKRETESTIFFGVFCICGP